MQSRIAYSIGRLERALRQRLAEVTGSVGLTVAQYTALSVLQARGQMSNAKLAQRSFVSPQAMNEILKAMVSKRMVARRPDPSHKRVVQISLTALGERILRECDAAVEEVEESMLERLSEAERLQFHGFLKTCIAELEEPRGRTPDKKLA